LTFVERIARQGCRVLSAGLHDWRRAIAARRRPVRRVPPPWAVNNPAQAPGPVKVSERFSQPAWCSSVIDNARNSAAAVCRRGDRPAAARSVLASLMTGRRQKRRASWA